MPSHTAASALVKLYSLNGAPWSWPKWQERTKVYHGLFPDNDDHLPKGWTRRNATDVHSYFRAYQLQPTEDKKMSFSVNSKTSSSYPGREYWNTYVSRRWRDWDIHTLVIEELRDSDVHPLNILIRDGDIDAPWPNADFFMPMILDTLGMKLFGEEAFPNSTSILATDLRRCLIIIAQRSWDCLRRQVSGLKSRRNEIEAAACAAFKDLENGKLTKSKVSRAIRAVAKWKECAELFSTPENLQKADEMLAELEAILEGLGAKLEKPEKQVKPKRTSHVSTLDLKTLATEEDVTDIINLYHEYFDKDAEDEDDTPLPDSSDAKQQLNDTGGDFGMEVEAAMTPASLAISLGFMSGRPSLFNALRHRSGLSPWDDATQFCDPQTEPLPQHLSPMRLHWHQLAGIHSITRSVFHSVAESPEQPRTLGVLVGDEVGLGKTAQAIGFIAFLIQSIWLKQRKRSPPRILKERPYLGASDKIPSLPHLIVCPGTLVAQWVSELKVFLHPKGVDIFVYDSQTNGIQFWSPSGPLNRSKHEPQHRIIVASHSAIFKDMNDLHRYSKKRGTRPWDIPPPKGSLKDTIFDQAFLTCVVDESHHMRNPGKKHVAALRLLQQATVRLIMTATPLHTSSKDVSSMGRLVGVPHFFTEASFSEEKDDAAAVRRAKKLDDDGEALLAEQLSVVKRLQGHLIGHFLRRTTASLNWNQEVLLPLPPYVEIAGVLTLTEREAAIVKARADTAKAAVESASSSSRIQTKKFYLEYRTAVGYAKEDPSEAWPSFKTVEEWEPVKSTKMDTCARLVVHYLTHDNVEDVTFVDGKPVFPDTATVPQAQIKKMRRIIIYAEFSSMAPLLQNVLQLYGIPSLAINGKVSFEKRDKLVKDFYDDNHPARVLVFSSVGSTGLNLSIADVVIFFDQPWSAQDERQIRGRAHRQPQSKTVKVIHLLASDSADLLMHGVARAKRDMFEAFVNKELGEELRQILQGHIPESVDDDEQKATAPAPRKRDKRREKPAVVEDVGPATSGDTILSSEAETLPTSEADLPSDFSGTMQGDKEEISEEEQMTEGEAGRPEVPRGSPMVVDDDDFSNGDANASYDLVGFPSPGNARKGSPPTKRLRQGTIGADGRAKILAAAADAQERQTAVTTESVPSSAGNPDGPQVSPTTGVPSLEFPRRQFLTPRGQKIAGSDVAPSWLSKKANTFPPAVGSAPAPSKQVNPFIRKIVPALPAPGPDEAGPSSSTSTVGRFPPAAPGEPSRQPGRLDDVAVPSRAALRPKPKRKATDGKKK